MAAAIPAVAKAGSWLLSNWKPVSAVASAVGSLFGGNKNKPAPTPQQQQSPQQQQLQNQMYQQASMGQASSQLGQQAQQMLQQRMQGGQQVVPTEIEQQMYDRMRDRINQEYDQQRSTMAESMNARGMYNSNIMSNADMKLGEWRNRSLADAARDIAIQNAGVQRDQDNMYLQMGLQQGQQGLDNAYRMLTGYYMPQQQQQYQGAYNEWLSNKEDGRQQRSALADIAAMLGQEYLGGIFPNPYN